MGNALALCWGVVRIACYQVCKICLPAEPPPRPIYDVLCLGMAGTGKSALLAALNHEPYTDLEPTKGFAIKPVLTSKVQFNVKEIGGADKMRAYWARFYADMQGLVGLSSRVCSLRSCTRSSFSAPARLSQIFLWDDQHQPDEALTEFARAAEALQRPQLLLIARSGPEWTPDAVRAKLPPPRRDDPRLVVCRVDCADLESLQAAFERFAAFYA
ncbi:uncharacterized protein MONBRDRAFT_5589 [Monosiga brevicollis MX1]|uniref:ADP-ribosylation factor-like protein 15 n=1 Tax=Monosiga brevicollis TaxID=81824 RepID=A9URW3_MONBE|nr:uncharacterized protein MONBRDRAFT_5589 [Monosiga brevicollis MX1]EDQ91675.1 predicted protein [Monosiga brevicollis MX1]|eukprot:XP_001742961.1 hypothetical protein [Monosiga brevicollis MX1]